MVKDGFAVFGAVVRVVAIIVLYPALVFILGAFFGWILQNILPWAGGWLVDGAGLLGIKVQMSDLPLLTATLAFIGAYFKSTSSSKK